MSNLTNQTNYTNYTLNTTININFHILEMSHQKTTNLKHKETILVKTTLKNLQKEYNSMLDKLRILNFGNRYSTFYFETSLINEDKLDKDIVNMYHSIDRVYEFLC